MSTDVKIGPFNMVGIIAERVNAEKNIFKIELSADCGCPALHTNGTAYKLHYVGSEHLNIGDVAAFSCCHILADGNTIRGILARGCCSVLGAMKSPGDEAPPMQYSDTNAKDMLNPSVPAKDIAPRTNI